jgi:hypothetical protein
MHIDAMPIWTVFAGTIRRPGDGMVLPERTRRARVELGADQAG